MRPRACMLLQALQVLKSLFQQVALWIVEGVGSSNGPFLQCCLGEIEVKGGVPCELQLVPDTCICSSELGVVPVYHRIIATARYDLTEQMLTQGSVGKWNWSKSSWAQVSCWQFVKSLTTKDTAVGLTAGPVASSLVPSCPSTALPTPRCAIAGWEYASIPESERSRWHFLGVERAGQFAPALFVPHRQSPIRYSSPSTSLIRALAVFWNFATKLPIAVHTPSCQCRYGDQDTTSCDSPEIGDWLLMGPVYVCLFPLVWQRIQES